MRIISKTTDYYDSIQSYGLDSAIVFVRNEIELTSSEVRDALLNGRVKKEPVTVDVLRMLLGSEVPQKKHRFGRVLWEGLDSRLGFFVIGFCGHFFPCVKAQHSRSTFDKGANDLFFFSGDDPGVIDEFVETLSSNAKPHESYIEPAKRKINRFLDLEFKSSVELFHRLQSPIIVFNVTDCYRVDKDCNIVLTVNANLADYKFFRVKDPFTAFQDIGQYLSGVLGNLEDSGSEISDQDMRDAKGFDDWSFKKRPSRRR